MNTRVIFSTLRKFNVVNPNEIVTFTNTPINVGEGMDGGTGVFTAPVSGFYSFSFSAQGDTLAPDTDIIMYRNDVYDFRIADHNKNGNYDMGNIAYSWNIRLDQNDRIYLKLTEESNSLFCSSSVYAWFNGHLLMAL